MDAVQWWQNLLVQLWEPAKVRAACRPLRCPVSCAEVGHGMCGCIQGCTCARISVLASSDVLSSIKQTLHQSYQPLSHLCIVGMTITLGVRKPCPCTILLNVIVLSHAACRGGSVLLSGTAVAFLSFVGLCFQVPITIQAQGGSAQAVLILRSQARVQPRCVAVVTVCNADVYTSYMVNI